MKEYEVTYSFGDVKRMVMADSEDEAEQKAHELLETDVNIQLDTVCDIIIVEEVEE